MRWVLEEAGFTTIDAALPWVWETNATGSEAWFFQNHRCMRIDVKDGTVKEGLKDLVDAFPPLKEAGFSAVDTAVLKSGFSGVQAYFFSGDKYACVDLQKNVHVWDVKFVRDAWSSLRSCGFYS